MIRPQLMLIGSTVVGSWLGMQAVHEAGHGGPKEAIEVRHLVVRATNEQIGKALAKRRLAQQSP